MEPSDALPTPLIVAAAEGVVGDDSGQKTECAGPSQEGDGALESVSGELEIGVGLAILALRLRDFGLDAFSLGVGRGVLELVRQ